MGSIGELQVRAKYPTCSDILTHDFSEEGQLDFDAMDAFMGHVLRALQEHGTKAVQVFPPEAGVLIAFAQRLAEEVVCRNHFLSLHVIYMCGIDSGIYHNYSGQSQRDFD